MIEWLLAPIDPTRAHAVSEAVAWHARLMVLAWCVMFPAGILAARFFKIRLAQDWPRQLDDKRWWIAHNGLQYGGGMIMIAALALVYSARAPQHNHAILGWLTLAGLITQFLGGWFRGSKGGPTDPAADGSLHGDHYSMTRRRQIFERVHKSVGYIVVLVAMAAIVSGLWFSNAPRWMWIAIGGWVVGVVLWAVSLQRRGRAIDTYQAIWGPDARHPGNALKPTGWGVRRPTERGRG
jgi:hypothetical protein